MLRFKPHTFSVITTLFIALTAVLSAGARNAAQSVRPSTPGSNQCTALIQAAIESTDSGCSDTTRNQACYGHVLNTAVSRPDVVDFTFDARGDKVNLRDVEELEVSPLDLLEERWGVVLMQVQANLPDALPGQNVTFILFGDVQMNNAVGTPVEQTASVLAPANIRVAPGDSRPILASLARGQQVIANGKAMTAEGELWVRLNHDPEREIYGWMRADLLDTPLDTLPDVQPADQNVNPMQAFYFKTGIGRPECVEAPPDGILIQTPQGAGKVNFTINGAEIALGSTGFLTSPDGTEPQTCLHLLEGESSITASDSTVTLKPGQVSCVQLDEDGIADSPPSDPVFYDPDTLAMLQPLLPLLPEDIELPEITITPTPTPTNTPAFVPAARTPTPTATATPQTEPPVQPTANPTATLIPRCDSDMGITTKCRPHASFTYYDYGLIIYFNNTSDVGSYAATYHWEFGDETTSTDPSPNHAYSSSGFYTVRLQVTTSTGTHRVSQTIAVGSVYTPTPITPTATAIPPTANMNLTVNGSELVFNDASTPGAGTIIGWNWDFGDGGTANAPGGSYVYSTGGTYTVSLTITDSNNQTAFVSSTITIQACAYHLTNTTTIDVGRAVADPPTTVYELHYKNLDCSDAGVVATLSTTNANVSTTIAHGRHYFVVQTAPCTQLVLDEIAGTGPIVRNIANACP
jgi:PKD repeat protein